ncbi:MAG: ATP cone domain-containing protein [Nanoarchaeota archaeon]
MKILKKDGHEEVFKRDKTYSSIYKSCLNANHDKDTAKRIASNVTNELIKHLMGKKFVKSETLFKYIATLLEKHDQDVALLYETHRDVN